jgi:hypothetical protein
MKRKAVRTKDDVQTELTAALHDYQRKVEAIQEELTLLDKPWKKDRNAKGETPGQTIPRLQKAVLL